MKKAILALMLILLMAGVGCEKPLTQEERLRLHKERIEQDERTAKHIEHIGELIEDERRKEQTVYVVIIGDERETK